MSKLIFLDCDETLWHSDTKDYISSRDSDFFLADPNTVVREADQTYFVTETGLRDTIVELFRLGYTIGIISDNRPEPVLKVLELIGIAKFLEKDAINIKLWDGYCPKEKMIVEVLTKPKFINTTAKDIYWFDDKDYSKQASEIGVNFYMVSSQKSLRSAIIDAGLV